MRFSHRGPSPVSLFLEMQGIATKAFGCSSGAVPGRSSPEITKKKSKGGDRKYGNLGRSGEAQAGLAGARVCSEGERGGRETRLGLTCGQQHGGGGEARGQVVTALVWRLLREPLGSTCGVTRIFRDKSGQLPPQNHLSSWALSGCFVERAGKASQEGPRERWRIRRNVPGGVRKSITSPLIREDEDGSMGK